MRPPPSGHALVATGLLMGSIFAVASFFGIATHAREEPWLDAAVGVLAIIAAPIFYGLLGFLGGLFIAAVHNVTARAMGGVELEIQDR